MQKKADSVHEFHNDEITNISTKLVLHLWKTNLFFKKDKWWTAGHINC